MTSTPDLPLFTRAEVATHNSRDDCWLIIGHSVYDVTALIGRRHPGGEAILRAAGGDATEGMITVRMRSGNEGHPQSAYQWADEEFRIGRVKD